MAGHAKYLSICDGLRKEILDGKYPAGSAFPSVMAVMRRFAISRLTAVRVINRLKDEGLLLVEWGRGTFVARRSRKIGIIVPGLAYSEIFAPIVSRVSELAQADGYTVLLGDIPTKDNSSRAELTRKFVRTLVEEDVAGVLCEPLEFLSDMDEQNRANMAMLDAKGIPVVLMDSDVEPPPRRSRYDVVGINNHDAGCAIAEHLLAQGVRKIAFQMRPNWAPSVRNRLRGIRSFCAEHPSVRCESLVAEPDDANALKRFLKAKGRPDAFVCGCDKAAARFAITLRSVGIAVPRDVLLCGFDDVEIASLMTPALTTVRQPCAEIGEALYRTLLARIANRTMPPQEILLPAPLVIRESTCRQPVA